MAAVAVAISNGDYAPKGHGDRYKNKHSEDAGEIRELYRPLKPETAVERMQRVVRAKMFNRVKLHRAKLAERLAFERDVVIGTIRLINQLMVFMLFVGALMMSSHEPTKRGIFQDLRTSFDFESIEAIQSKADFVRIGMPSIAAKAKQYFLLSSKYFDPGMDGTLQLVGDMEVFARPKLGAQLNLKVPEYSLTTWIRTDATFVGGYILRKRPVNAGAGSSLSCWSWYLHRSFGPQLHYGAHDYYEYGSSESQYTVKMSSPPVFPPNKFAMLTMTISGDTVTFYENLDLVGTQKLPRSQITDCNNNNEGLLIGDTGMELGNLRYYPRLLSNTAIRELFSAGGLLADISTGSEPLFPEVSEVSSIGGSLASSIEGIEAGIEGRQHLSELNAILQAVEAAQSSATTTARPPDAPVGEYEVNQTQVLDHATNRLYYSMYHGPGRLSSTALLDEASQRHFTGVPDFSGTGMTLSFWYRHVPCAVENCGVYLFVAFDDDRNYCWSLWLENSAIWFDNLLGTPQQYQYPRDFVDDKFELNGDQVWRHLAMVMDETTDMVRYYVDGDLAWTGTWLSPVSGAHCNGNNSRVSFGRTEPGFTYGNTVEVYDLRMYVHSKTAANPLQDADIARIATSPTPGLDELSMCLPITSDKMRDGDWIDTYGHTCAWYASNKEENPSVCNYPAAAANCPIACQSRQECFQRTENPPVYFNWDRIRRIEANTSKGSMCLSSEWNERNVVQQCRDWMASTGGNTPDAAGWRNSLGLDGGIVNRGRMLNVTDCDELEDAIDEGCAFNATAVEHFTKDVHANGGDYTLAFWIKPLGAMSLHPELNRFFPGLKFYSTVSPPQHPLTLSLWANPNGEFRWFSSCDQGARDIYENVEIKGAANDDWTFLAVSRRNSSAPADREYAVATNLGRNWEGSQMAQCFWDPEHFFNALEVNYASLISPIMMVPKYLPFARIQEMYLANVKDMGTRSGPVVSKSEVDRGSQIDIEKQDYNPRAALTAPPIIFQSRFLPSAECPVTYGTSFVRSQHKKVQDFVCAAPFQCEDGVIEQPERTMACPGELQENGTQYGLSPMEFLGSTGYADFLFSLTENPFLFRDGDVSSTFNFVDSMTENVQVILVFFTPLKGVTSVMNVQADFAGDSAANVKVHLSHFEILEGKELKGYVAVQSIVLVSIGIMVFDIILNVRHLILEVIHGERLKVSSVVKQVVDVATATMVIVFIAVRIPSKVSSADDAEGIVGGMNEIQWDSTSITLEEKTSQFFTQVNQLLDLIDKEDSLARFCIALLFVSLLRVIQCTALHPRLALLTGTVVKALDDLWHAFLLIVLLMACFAVIATWRFGSTRADFGSMEMSFYTQFMMMFGEFPENWTENGDLVIYTIFYFIIVFLLVQNFLLAIIVEAYMQVRKDNEEQETEMEFTTDVYECFGAHYLAWKHGWPRPGLLGRIVDSWNCKMSVGFQELWNTGGFRNQKSVMNFLKHYQKFDFLECDEVSQYLPPKPGEELLDKIERRISRLLGFRQLTLKEYADSNIKSSKLWRKLASKGEGAKEHGEEAAAPVAWGASVKDLHAGGNGHEHLQNGHGSTMLRVFPGGGGVHDEATDAFQKRVLDRMEAQDQQLSQLVKALNRTEDSGWAKKSSNGDAHANGRGSRPPSQMKSNGGTAHAVENEETIPGVPETAWTG